LQALVLNEQQKLEIRELDMPEPGPGQVRIKVKRAGICASDIGYWKHGSDRLKLPVALGHEASGIVDKVGDRVTTCKPGDRVVPQTTYHICGKCRFCREERYNICPSRVGIGSKANGGFAEYLVIPESSVMIMPDSMTFEEGAIVEPLACGVHALVEETHVPVNSAVVVMGPGPIGLLAAQVAKVSGAKVVVAGLSSDKSRLEIAKKDLGMDDTIDIQRQDIKEIIYKMTDNYGADVVVECSGSNSAVNLALDIVAKRGTVVQMGVLNRPGEIDFSKIMFKELKVIGSLSQKPTAWYTAMDLIKDRKVNVNAVTSHILPLNQWERAFQIAANQEGLKVLLDPEDSIS